MKFKNIKYLGILATIVLSGWLVSPLSGTMTVPNTFVPYQTISSSSMNANFTFIAEAALNRHGDNIDGNVTVSSTKTIDGADISTYLANSKVTALSTAADAVKSAGGITAGSGNVAIVDTTGKLPALSSTYLASLTAANLTSIPAAQVTGNLPLQVYTESKTAPTISAGTLVIDQSAGTYFVVSLNANVTTLTLSNPCTTGKACSFTVGFVADGTARTISWPASVKWAGGVAPTPTSTSTKIDFYSFITYDGGTTYYAFIGGQNF